MAPGEKCALGCNASRLEYKPCVKRLVKFLFCLMGLALSAQLFRTAPL